MSYKHPNGAHQSPPSTGGSSHVGSHHRLWEWGGLPFADTPTVVDPTPEVDDKGIYNFGTDMR